MIRHLSLLELSVKMNLPIANCLSDDSGSQLTLQIGGTGGVDLNPVQVPSIFIPHIYSYPR